MAIDKVSQVAGPTGATSIEAGKESFGKFLESAPRQVVGARPPADCPDPSRTGAASNPPPIRDGARGSRRVDSAQSARAQQAAQVLDRVSAAQRRLDQVLSLAQSGKTFTPAELLAVQAQVYRASQELDLAGKVVEKATSGVKQVLQTQL